MKRKLVLLLVTLTLIISIVPINASLNISGLQQQIQANNNKINELRDKLNQIKGEQSSVQNEIDSYDTEIEMYNYEIDGYQLQIDDLNRKIQENEQNIIKLNKEIDDNNTILEKRLRTMYKKGTGGYIEVILNAENILDALTRIDMIQRIVQEDVNLLKDIETQKKEVEDLKVEQEKEKAEIEVVKKDIEAKKSVVVAAQTKKEAYMAELMKDANYVARLEKQMENANKDIEKQILAAQSAQEYAGGEMAWPAPGHYRITSYFGTRPDPITGYISNHRGMDIGCPYNSNIVAANSGTVTFAGWHYSYGYYVLIDHGGGISTLYGHNTRLLVSTGQTVSRGQSIALSGSTGYSTGPHLHFEVRKNGVVQDPLNYLK